MNLEFQIYDYNEDHDEIEEDEEQTDKYNKKLGHILLITTLFNIFKYLISFSLFLFLITIFDAIIYLGFFIKILEYILSSP